MARAARPRQVDVAARARVSPAIVSLVINGRVNGSVKISSQTQERVWAAVRELGYVVNPVARSLAGGRNHLLGVFTYDPIFPLRQQNFYFPFLVGIEEEAEAQDYDLLLFTRTGGPGGKRSVYWDGVNSLQLADGALVLGNVPEPDELARLCQEQFPYVCVGRRAVPGVEVSYVAADYVAATAEVVRYIAGKGHRRIAYWYTATNGESGQDRASGFRLGHQQLGLPFDERLSWCGEAADVTPAVLAAAFAARATALVVENALFAVRALDFARGDGKQVPGDLSLAVLGDPMDADEAIPDVTMFRIPRREMGACAVQLLVRMLAVGSDASLQREVLPCTFVPGQTVTAPRTAFASGALADG